MNQLTEETQILDSRHNIVRLALISSVTPPFIGPKLIAALKAHGVALSVTSAHSLSEYAALRGRLGGGFLRHYFDLWFSLKVILSRIFRPKPTGGFVDILTTNPWYLPLPLMAVDKIRGVKTRLFLLDLYPEALIAGGLISESGLAARVLRRVTTLTLRLADKVVFLGENLQRYAVQRYPGITSSAVVCLGPSEELRLATSTLKSSDSVSVVYSGNIGPLHDSETVRGALQLLVESGESQLPTVFLVARGANAARLAPAELANFITRHDPLQSNEWSEVMSHCDVSIVTLERGAERISFPSKIWSAISAGHAIVAIADSESDLVRLVTRHNLGWSFRNGDASGVAALLRSLSQRTAELTIKQTNSVAYSAKFLSAEILAEDWIRAFG